ncbi:uncharacterized protein LOC109104798 [Tachysurus ichikawai]
MTSQKHKQGLAEIKALENILDGCKFDLSTVDEVWPNLYIGNVAIAQNKSALRKMGITHILNAAHAKQGSIGDESYYGTEFVYHGIPAEDSGRFDISVHFRAIAQNKSALRKMGITHILNAAHAKQGSIGDESYYGTEFVYHGIPAEDSGRFDISVHFRLSLKELCAYETPSVAELQDFLLADRHPTGHVNQVWPNVYIGNEVAARDKSMLYSMGITHIVNAASGPPHVNTGPRFYRDMAVDYYEVVADDSTDFIMSVFFYPTARFIHATLSNKGKVFVHCLMGVSRSATLVLAFLMICEQLTLKEAARVVRQHRDICPNPGFLNQLRHLDMSLVRERKRKLEAFKL